MGLICHDTIDDQMLEWDVDDVDDDEAAAVLVAAAITRLPVHIKIDPANKRAMESRRRRLATLDPFVDEDDSWWCGSIPGFCIDGSASLLQQRLVVVVVVMVRKGR
jgi:hypothetical protein